MYPIPCCFLPTTVVFIDDDIAFLNSISAECEVNDIPHLNFSEPRLAIKHINEDCYIQKFLKREAQYVEEYEYGAESITQYILEVIKQVFNKERYNQVSVAVIDYEMPSLNGLEVCRKIQNPYVKKILLTGAADESLAVEAFNEGLIYKFIRKHDADYRQKLAQAIAQAQQEYFCEVFKNILKSFEYLPVPSPLLDPVFIEYFNELITEHKIKEYYLVESTGTFFMIDENNNYKSLFTLRGDMLDTFLPDEPIPLIDADKLAKLQQGEIIFCFSDPFYTEPFDPDEYEDWDPYLNTPKVINGNDRYYTYFSDNLIHLPEDKIKLYEQKNSPRL